MRGTRKSFTEKPALPFQSEVVELHTRGYPLKRKIAIGFWLLALFASSVIAFRCYSIYEEHIDYLMRVDLTLMANYQFDQAKTSFFIPIFDYARYPTFALTLWLAWKSLKALFLAPIVRTDRVSIHMMHAEPSSDA